MVTPAKEPVPNSGFRGTGSEGIPAEPGKFFLRALDVLNGDLKWEYPMPGPAVMWAGTVSTAGGLVFSGDDDGNLVALDARTGKDLWHFSTGHSLFASPVTYEIDGRQYVTIATESDVFTFGFTNDDLSTTAAYTDTDWHHWACTFDPETDANGAYVYTVTPAAPCPVATAIIDINVIAPVVASFLATTNGSCAPAEVSFSHDYTGPGTCTWILGNGDIVLDCAPFTATYTDPGSYDVTLIVDAGNSCGADTVTIEDVVNVYAAPFANFEIVPPQLNTLDPTAYFNNLTTGANTYAGTSDNTQLHLTGDIQRNALLSGDQVFQAISRGNPIFYVISGFRFGFLGQSDIGSTNMAVLGGAIGLGLLNLALLALTFVLLKRGWKLKS